MSGANPGGMGIFSNRQSAGPLSSAGARSGPAAPAARPNNETMTQRMVVLLMVYIPPPGLGYAGRVARPG